MIPTRLLGAALTLFAAVAVAQGGAKPRPGQAAPARADLADLAAGSYAGDVISDSRGSSQSNVVLTVAKIGPNKVTVSSSYPRLPKFTVGLTRVGQTIQAANGYATNFLLDLLRRPNRLDVNVDGASWSGVRR